eukprot:GHVQ01021754.1.p1 GENE.GHVQ01021754.1~~GHVQ01021754.1.p1  ORF type:complete len:456 (+),score=69.81 GHVQ01021754.1:427-1794(+)
MNKANVQRGGGCAFTCPRLFQISMVILAMVAPVVAMNEWKELANNVSLVSQELEHYQPNLETCASAIAANKIDKLLGEAAEVTEAAHLRGSSNREELKAAGAWFLQNVRPIRSAISERAAKKKMLQTQSAAFSLLVAKMSSIVVSERAAKEKKLQDEVAALTDLIDKLPPTVVSERAAKEKKLQDEVAALTDLIDKLPPTVENAQRPQWDSRSTTEALGTKEFVMSIIKWKLGRKDGEESIEELGRKDGEESIEELGRKDGEESIEGEAIDPEELLKYMNKWKEVPQSWINETEERNFSEWSLFSPTAPNALDTAWLPSPPVGYIPKGDAAQDSQQVIEADHNDGTKTWMQNTLTTSRSIAKFLSLLKLKSEAMLELDNYKEAYELAAGGSTHLPELKRQLAKCVSFAVLLLEEFQEERPHLLESTSAKQIDAAIRQSKKLLGVLKAEERGVNPH